MRLRETLSTKKGPTAGIRRVRAGTRSKRAWRLSWRSASRISIGANSPQRLFSTHAPGAVVFRATFFPVAQRRQYLAGAWQRPAVGVLLRVPQVGAQKRAGAL